MSTPSARAPARPPSPAGAAGGFEPGPHADAGEQEEPLIEHLELDQLVAETLRPVPRARLGARAAATLWVLRALVVLVGLMVLYAFFERL